MDTIIHLLAPALYLSVAFLLWRRLESEASFTGGAKTGTLTLGVGALALHAAIVYADLWQAPGLNLGLTSVANLMALVIAALFLIAAAFRPVENLGIVILPVAAFVILLGWLAPSRPELIPYGSRLLVTHLVISILGYGLLCIAAVQSLVLAFQDRHLHAKQHVASMRALPPVETMETLMFQLIGLGFALLTLTLVSGIFFSEQVFGKPLAFTHHIVLSVIAWATFGILLVGRLRFGWRGRHAARWVLGGFFLLVIGYFGSKFVLEVVLGR